jgi:hypothetical protein
MKLESGGLANGRILQVVQVLAWGGSVVKVMTKNTKIKTKTSTPSHFVP